ncbi:hypothetical protein SAMN04515648_0691 [Phyllobacterium sp. CL33Tsu]|nr:hypothetical protein SAMN04515648_0691 [Phyllobacterium sp. CL33Tsu]
MCVRMHANWKRLDASMRVLPQFIENINGQARNGFRARLPPARVSGTEGQFFWSPEMREPTIYR